MELYISKSKESECGLNYSWFSVHNERGTLVAQAHVLERKGHLTIDGVVVEDDYQRMGIGTTLYCVIEDTLGKHIKQSKECTPSSKALWAQANKPFGV